MIGDTEPILFLDFDGVLHPSSAYLSAPFSRAPMLAEALADRQVHVVVSSSWRFGRELDELRGLLPGGLADRVIGTTGDPHDGEHARYHEILASLRDFGPGRAWRALDDAAFEFPDGCQELILCDPNVGLDRFVISRIQCWLDELMRGTR